MRAPPPKKVNTCCFCTPGVTHIIDPSVYPNDVIAEKDKSGKWKCGNCQEKELQDRIIRVTPDSERAKEILQERRLKQQKDLAFKQREKEIRRMNVKK
jgi:hypothetical protein